MLRQLRHSVRQAPTALRSLARKLRTPCRCDNDNHATRLNQNLLARLNHLNWLQSLVNQPLPLQWQAILEERFRLCPIS